MVFVIFSGFTTVFVAVFVGFRGFRQGAVMVVVTLPMFLDVFVGFRHFVVIVVAPIFVFSPGFGALLRRFRPMFVVVSVNSYVFFGGFRWFSFLFGHCCCPGFRGFSGFWGPSASVLSVGGLGFRHFACIFIGFRRFSSLFGHCFCPGFRVFSEF